MQLGNLDDPDVNVRVFRFDEPPNVIFARSGHGLGNRARILDVVGNAVGVHFCLCFLVKVGDWSLPYNVSFTKRVCFVKIAVLLGF